MKGLEKAGKITAIVILIPTVSLCAFIIICEITGHRFKSDGIAKAISEYSSEVSKFLMESPPTQTTQEEIALINEEPMISDAQTEVEEEIPLIDELSIETQEELLIVDERIINMQDDVTSTETIGAKNALNKAKQYLAYQAFSNTGLIEQLKFDGFTVEESTYGVKNCGADWSSQALEKAEQYINYQPFSNTGLTEQLKFDGFTNEQAQYGVANCGADWNEQAMKKAEQYMNYSSFSKDGLIEQLVFDGFTNEQAQYGVTAVGY